MSNDQPTINDRLMRMNVGDGMALDSETEVLKVPGGWIFTSFYRRDIGNSNLSSCFVPLTKEKQQ